ncbi:MAG: tetratricopeptide repeat protein [Acetobacteraceae bacterium]|nr:tetratricopeptide repeat protein [Acetobacteraceae bacterium]
MSEQSQGVGALFRAGRLAEAVSAANEGVRRKPADLGARVLLAEMLLFAGNLERADVILDAAGEANPAAATVIAEFRQLLRAEVARRQVYRDGRLPEFLGEPSPQERARLAALVALRASDSAEAARRAEEAERLRGTLPGHAADVAFKDFRDADDLLGGTLEVLTTTGKYYWIPAARVSDMTLHPPRRPRDLAWRRASLTVTDGPDGEVYIPVIYWSDAPDLGDDLRLGRATDWREEAGLVRGVGQRTFLVGDAAVSIMELATLRFGP